MGGAAEQNAGASDRGSEQRDTSRAADAWSRVEPEKPDRDAARKAWDASHDPSPEFTQAARPLSNEFGRDRPAQRELTPEQRAELEEAFDRPADELLALREQDPRAGHNRDEQGRILDQHGQPRTELTPAEAEQEAERQAREYGPGTDWHAEHIAQRQQTDQPEQTEQADQPEQTEQLGQLEGAAQAEQAGQPEHPENADHSDQVSDTSNSEPTISDDKRLANPELSPDLQAPSDHQNEQDDTDTSDNTETTERAEPAQDTGSVKGSEDAELQDTGDGMGQGAGPPGGDVPRPAATSGDEPAGLERPSSDAPRIPGPLEVDTIPPDAKYAIVRIDDNGQPDWNTVEYHDGSSRIDQLDSDRRIRRDHGDRDAESPTPTGAELSGQEEMLDPGEDLSSYEGAVREVRRAEWIDNYHDTWEEAGDIVDGLISERPPAYSHTIAPDQPIATEYRPHIDGGDAMSAAATAVLITWIMADRYGRSLHAKVQNWRSRRADSDENH